MDSSFPWLLRVLLVKKKTQEFIVDSRHNTVKPCSHSNMVMDNLAPMQLIKTKWQMNKELMMLALTEIFKQGRFNLCSLYSRNAFNQG